MSANEVTQFGFRWGPAEVIRYAELPDGRVCIGVETFGKRRLDIYVSRTGRSVRVFEVGHGELVRAALSGADTEQNT